MCIVIYKPQGKRLPKQQLVNSWQANKDGAGFAYADGEKVHIVKGFMHFKRFWKEYRKHQDKACLIHFRIATCGSVCPANTHPFKLNDECAMAHNGMLSISPPKGYDMTDSEIFLRAAIMPLIGNEPANAKLWLNSFSLRYLVEKAASGSKLVFLHADGTATIYNESSGHWADDVWYSNSSYKYKSTRYHKGKSYSYGGGSYNDWEERNYGRSLYETDHGYDYTNYEIDYEATPSAYNKKDHRYDAHTHQYYPVKKRVTESKKKEEVAKTTEKQQADTTHGSANVKQDVETYAETAFPIIKSAAFRAQYDDIASIESATNLVTLAAYYMLAYGVRVDEGHVREQLQEYEKDLREGLRLTFLFEGYQWPVDYEAVALLYALWARVIELGLTRSFLQMFVALKEDGEATAIFSTQVTDDEELAPNGTHDLLSVALEVNEDEESKDEVAPFG